MARERPALLPASSAKRVTRVKSKPRTSKKTSTKVADPWVKHDGIFVGDPYFAEVVKDIAKKRKKLKA